ncbi:MAG: hypothetical protein GXY13_08045 [Acidimicrobiales bacterium]|nr:hypothetical protein [Acidimicrobiales bacterium]
MRRVLGVLGVAALFVGGLAGCEVGSTLKRSGAPAVLTGAELPDLIGAEPGDIVAFRHSRIDGEPTWTQIPVQVDERKVIAFGHQPGTNAHVGQTGSVYGTAATGATALQYADPGTFVGADGDPTFDADDELVFMLSDAGGVAPADAGEPAGVVPGSGVAVRADDPLDGGASGWVYLFTSPTLDPSAGRDYVTYDFQLVSGDYKTTYLRADGPNPETSVVTTDRYRIGFTDRWFETEWRTRNAGGLGPDLLDGHKNVFAFGVCGRSNATFNDAEGAFVANLDGPVRAIRSYVGANSGPKTQRTHFFYRDREVIRTDLRVHAIPAIADYLDYSASAVGMTYRSSTTAGVTIDGVQDSVSSEIASWEAVHGTQGTLLITNRFTTTASGLATTWFHRDQTDPPEDQCWGDDHYYGASGAHIVGPIANTDPASPPFATLTGSRTIVFLPGTTDAAAVTAGATAVADDADHPITLAAAAYTP